VVEEAAPPEVEAPAASPTEIYSSPANSERGSPTSPAEGKLVADQPEVTGDVGGAAEEQVGAAVAEPEGEDAVPMVPNVSVASGAVSTPTGAAVVSTEPVREEREDSLPDFSEEEKAQR
jgi:hypothetical protein